MSETLTERLEHNFDMDALLKQYDDRWLTVRVENEGFFIIRDNKILPIAGPGHYQAWFASEFGIPPGIRPALQQPAPTSQQAPVEVSHDPTPDEQVGFLRSVMGGKK